MKPKRDDVASESELAQARRLLSAAAIRALAEDRWRRDRPWIDWPALRVCLALLVMLFAPANLRIHKVPPLDSIANETVRADHDMVLEDQPATAQLRAAAAADVLPVFDYDPDLYFTLGEKVSTAVKTMVQRKHQAAMDPADRRAAFQQDLNVPVRPPVFELIEGLSEPDDLAVAINFLLNIALDRMVVAERQSLPARGGLMIRIDRRKETRELTDTGGILDTAQLRRLMAARAGDAPYGQARVVRSFVQDTAPALAPANLRPDAAATEAGRKAALAQIKPVFVRVAAGEVIVREGDRITQAVQERFQKLNASVKTRRFWVEQAAFAAIAAVLLLFAGWYFRRGRKAYKSDRKEAYITLTVVLLVAVICVAALFAGRGLADGIGFGRGAVMFLPPIALVSLLMTVLIGARASLLGAIGLSLLLAYRAEGHVLLAAYYVIGALVGGFVARNCRRRSELLRAGLVIGAAQAAVAPLVLLLSSNSLTIGQILAAMGCALVSGGVAAVAAAGLLPVLEWIFQEATDLKLLELTSADHPLQKQLALQSPGTYYHSMIMANLAEAAADDIGANGLQCRVMALYHDLGKMRRPSYFAENQRGGNVHDRLPPELSARIIFAHIKDGIEIAHKHRLGRAVLDAITQHQGTTLLRAFYVKALEQAAATGVAVDENEFRYPGPRPVTPESGILLLADSTEAATRALRDPSPAEVRERVHKIITDKLADGQLDDCALTVRDIARIEAAFLRVLTLGVYHNRIEYPPMPQPTAAEPRHESPENRADDRRFRLGDGAA